MVEQEVKEKKIRTEKLETTSSTNKQSHRNPKVIRNLNQDFYAPEQHPQDYLSLIRSSALKLVIILFHNWANLAASFSLLDGICKNIEISIIQGKNSSIFFYLVKLQMHPKQVIKHRK